MKKVCPRCGVAFECMHDQILSCHCATVGLNEQQRAYLQKNYSDCLCHGCLMLIKESMVVNVCDVSFCSKQENDNKDSIDYR